MNALEGVKNSEVAILQSSTTKGKDRDARVEIFLQDDMRLSLAVVRSVDDSLRGKIVDVLILP